MQYENFFRIASKRPDVNMYEQYGKCNVKGCNEHRDGIDEPSCKQHANK